MHAFLAAEVVMECWSRGKKGSCVQLTKAMRTQVHAYCSFHTDSALNIAGRGTIQKYHTVPEYGRVGHALPTTKVKSSLKR